MPRLSDSSVPAYPERNQNNTKIFRMVIIFFMILLIRNMFLKDYRSEEINILRKSGLSKEDIESYVPPKLSERIQERKNTLDEHNQMKEDLAKLKEEMKMLKEKLGIVDDPKKEESGASGASGEKDNSVKVEKKDNSNSSLEEEKI